MRSFQDFKPNGMDLESQAIPSETFASTEMRPEPPGSVSNTIACDLGSLLSFSCRTRAESFARKLHLKLKTLGSFDGNEEQPVSNSLLDEVNCKPTVPSSSSYPWDSSLESATAELEKLSCSIESSPMLSNKASPAATTPEAAVKSPKSYPSVFRPPPEDPANTSTDSDIFYDFDIGPGSPGSPVENGSCFTVINPCDDLHCQDCLGQNSTSSASNGVGGSHHQPHLTNGHELAGPNETSNGIETADLDFESGCVFSSPASTSPDGYETVTEDPLQIQHSASADDCTSDASDSSVYYDVESSLESQAEGLTQQSASVAVPVPDGKQVSSPFTISDRQLLTPGFGLAQSEEFDEDDNGLTRERPRITRSKSLKTGKTPPGTPGRKKIVRFADALGLDLAAIRTFLDEIPNVPKSAFRDLECPVEAPSFLTLSASLQRPSTAFNKVLVPTFHQPVSRSDFFDRIRDQKVLLENAYLSDNFTIKGGVRVMNMDFYKSVYIRYTLDEWKTCTDFQATYVNGSCDGFSDLFEFALTLKPEAVEIGTRLMMAVRFHCKGEQFWDSNNGQNYLFHCVPSSTQSSQQGLYHDNQLYSSADDPWITHMW